MASRQALPKLDIPPHHGWRVGIVRAVYNESVTEAMLQEAQQCLESYGVDHDVITVPGAFEVVHIADRMLATGRYAGIVTLGCLVKGATIHDEVISHAVAQGAMALQSKYASPVGFGIMNANTLAEAEARTWHGFDAAYAVLSGLVHAPSGG
ncbi:MAG TPA: 6,7-dimethyl-8-ribityllumazine synthase [Deltaproteobacteria bacterium]|nr:6,7-dimethyl-8-ribityllumazine synthase [Deltaproteobacteria bacterium]|tara:strand:+ start:77 stop:532 length:456 start_codon:yes stop_codon:yes gene_type:complete